MKKRGVFFYILIFLALAAVAGLVFFLAPGRQVSTPPVLLPTPQLPDSSAPPAQESVTGGQAIAVTPATVQTVIATLYRSDSYSRSLTVQDFWSGGSRIRSFQVWVRGDSLRLTVSDTDEPAQVLENLLIKDGEKWIWYGDDSGVYRGPALPGDADAYQTILTYEDLLAAPAEDILDADYRDFSEKNCVYVRWRSGALGYVSECWIDPDTGLLMGERRYDGDILIYSMDSSSPDLTTPDESVFTAPRT